MTENPTSFDAALTEAEHAAFAVLYAATGTEPGRTALLAYNPGAVDAWTFELDVPTAVESIRDAPDLPAIAWVARATCRFRHRARAQSWIMQIIRALPIRDIGVLKHLRVVDVSGVVLQEFAVGSRAQQLWTATITMDTVFVTGGKE